MNDSNKISKKALEEMVREIVVKKMSEHDVIYKKKEAWQEAKEKLKSGMKELMDNIENDDYKDGLNKIDEVVSMLNSWKSKIQKNI